MTKIEQIIEHYGDYEWLSADGFDDAIIGVVFEPINKVVYSNTKCIKILVQQGMSEEDAIEFFEYNVLGSYVGENTPIFVEDVVI